MKELEIKTGRRAEDIKAGLLALEKDNYIVWEDKTDTRHIIIIEGWDRNAKISTPPTPPGTVNRYYTEY
ncbi:hypothetical protein UY456_14425 [Paenibacillus polymyxa]|uniref:hypothetical protein n=1 Tax=Paenibacillus polymyxa TaxID=1406 RepID=UPI002AB3310B|nr:hypothetical protein [Paenibacillus polymyxa]MDY8094193.1 hypothetical protein [Paenibacillus polymyxa]